LRSQGTDHWKELVIYVAGIELFVDSGFAQV